MNGDKADTGGMKEEKARKEESKRERILYTAEIKEGYPGRKGR